jgi:hypothetical protein
LVDVNIVGSITSENRVLDAAASQPEAKTVHRSLVSGAALSHPGDEATVAPIVSFSALAALIVQVSEPGTRLVVGALAAVALALSPFLMTSATRQPTLATRFSAIAGVMVVLTQLSDPEVRILVGTVAAISLVLSWRAMEEQAG